jgi:hypothetical protein
MANDKTKKPHRRGRGRRAIKRPGLSKEHKDNGGNLFGNI